MRKQAIEPSRGLINQLIMNYLVVKGYKEGALKFQKEAGIQGKSQWIHLNAWFIAEMDEELIDSRIQVRKLIESGNI